MGCEWETTAPLTFHFSAEVALRQSIFFWTMAQNRDSCVFYASWFDAIEVLPEAVQSEAYRAILSFALRGVETEKQGAMTKLIMAMVRPQIEANIKRYENGCKGGRPKAEKKPNQNQTITKPKPNRNLMIM